MEKLNKSLIFSCLLLIMATGVRAQGTINLTDGTGTGTGWTFSGNVFAITDDVIIEGSTNLYRVVVVSGNTVNITLKDAEIDVSISGECAFNMLGSVVNLTLIGDNILASGGYYAGLYVASSLSITSELTISGGGTLTATAYNYSAGIGGSSSGLANGLLPQAGKIVIENGSIIAKSVNTSGYGGSGAGIGGASGGNGGEIIINGGTVEASSADGAGIGGGIGADGGTITINGGTVEASSVMGAGIGGGLAGDGGNISITGGTIYAESNTDGKSGAGIGGGADDDSASLPAGNGGTITISNTADVTALSKGGGAGIGGGNNTNELGGPGVGGNGGTITISNTAVVKAESINGGAGIGGGVKGKGGNITIEDAADVTATSDGGGAGIGGGLTADGENITITGGRVDATTTHYLNTNTGAGIGGGSQDDSGPTIIPGGEGGTITISNNAIVNAESYGGGAGIGGGNGGGNGGTIEISDQVVVSAYSENGGAGIGGGNGGNSGSIHIYNGNIIAKSELDGAGIGGGSDGHCVDITIDNGTVQATAISGGGAGIGGGVFGAGGIITINGGTVTGENLEFGCGIGPGSDGNSGDIYIYTGSTVSAIAHNISSGIYGDIYVGDKITYKGGGILYATAYDEGFDPMIGPGPAIDGNLYVYEGQVYANSDGTAISVRDMDVVSGQITATGDAGYGISAYIFTMNGGQITATTNIEDGINADNIYLLDGEISATSAMETGITSLYINMTEGMITAISNAGPGIAIPDNSFSYLPSNYLYWINPSAPVIPATSNSFITTPPSGTAFPNATSSAYQYIRIRSGVLSITALTSSINPSAHGQSVTFTAAVTKSQDVGGALDGTVQFYVDGLPWGGPAVLNPSGIATTTITSLSVGVHTITAEYSGDAIYTPSISNTINQTVNGTSLLSSTTTITSSLNPSEEGDDVTFTAKVTPTAATGTVQFYVDGMIFGSPVTLNGSGIATISTSTLSVGNRTIEAVYDGNTTHASSSASLTQEVYPGKIPLELTGVTATKEYDGNIFFTAAQIDTTGAVLTGVLSKDIVSYTKAGVTGEYGPGVGTGTLRLTFPFTLTGRDADKYKLVQPTVTATIKPKAITVKANGGASHFGTEPENPGLSATGLAKGETASVLTDLTNSFAITATTPIGTYILTVEGNLTNPNYTLAAKDTGIWIVNKPLLVVAAVSQTIAENETPVLRYEIRQGSLLAGDQITGELSCPPPYTIGSHPITQGTLTVPDHYDFTFIPGVLTILSVDVEIVEIVVNGKNPIRTGNGFFFKTECGETQCDLTVATYDKNATIQINGIQQNSTIVNLPHYGDNTFEIIITSQYGISQKYTLTAHRSVPIPIAFFDRFNDVLTVPTYVEGVGAINSVEWYYNDALIDRDPVKGYFEMTNAGVYYALLNGSIRTCEVIKTTSSTAMTVFPNPVDMNRDITIEIATNDDLALKGALLQLYGFDGRLLQTVPVTGKVMKFAAPAQKGMVVIKLISDRGAENVKLIVK